MNNRKIKKVVLALCGIVFVFYYFFNLNLYFCPMNVSGINYDYMLAHDHVEIEKYKGNRAKVVIPKYIWGKPVTILKRDCFADNNNMEEVIIPDTVTDVYERAFENCGSLKSVTLGKSMKYIGTSVFESDVNLTTVNMNNSIEEIGWFAFNNCENLKEISLPDSVRKIQTRAFSSSGLERINIPDSVQKIEPYAFHNTKWLSNQEGYVICGDQILISYNGTGSKLIIPNGVRAVVDVPWENSNIKEIYFPDSVEKIEIDNYTDRSLEFKLYIPESVISIDDGNDLFNHDDVEFVIQKDSYAEKYAMEYNIDFQIEDDIQNLYSEAVDNEK